MSTVSKLKEKSKLELIEKIIGLEEKLYCEKNLKPSSCKGYQPKDKVDPNKVRPPKGASAAVQGSDNLERC